MTVVRLMILGLIGLHLGAAFGGEVKSATSAPDGRLEGSRWRKPASFDVNRYAQLFSPTAVVIDASAWPTGEGPQASENRRTAFLEIIPDRKNLLLVDRGADLSEIQYYPLPQGDDLAFTQSGFQSWVPPLAEGYTWGSPARGWVNLSGKGALWDERRSVYGEILPKRGRGARLLMRIFWYDHPIDAEFVVAMAKSRISGELAPYAICGTTVWSDWATPGSERLYAWLSGDRVIFLDLSGMSDEEKLLTPFLTQYPPTWPDGFTFDVDRWHERLFEMALSNMRSGLEDPAPRLRYDFQKYAFDAGVKQIRLSTLPRYADRLAFEQRHLDAITKAFDQHILGTENRLDGDAYQAAVKAERERVIAEVEAWRERLRAAGGVVLTEKGYRMRGNEQDP